MDKLMSNIGPEHVFGAIFIAYVVIKEVFILVKGETKEILKSLNKLVSRFEVLESKIEKIEAIHDIVEDIDTKTNKIDKVYEWVNDWHRDKDFVVTKVKELIEQTEDLWEWHNKEDEDGVKIWYVRSSLQKTLGRLNTVLETENILMEKIIIKVTSLEEELNSIKEDLSKQE